MPPQPGAGTAALESRGRQILAALQARARAQGRDPLDEDEQRTVLETVTDLPPDVIDRIVPSGSVSTASTAAGTGPAKTTQPWQNDFPIPIQDAVATATRSAPASSAPATRNRPTRQIGRRPRRRT
jgi:type II secretory pathway pseudopilin PulG